MRSRIPAAGLCLAGLLLVQAGSAAPGEDRPVVDRAAALLAGGDAAAAAEAYAEALRRSPEDETALHGRVRALLRLDRWREALAEARDFAARRAGATASAALGEALIRAGRLAEARGVLEPLAADPDCGGRGLVAWARVLAAEGRAEAETFAAQAVERSPDDPDVLAHAAELTPDRATTIDRLRRYLDLAGAADPDRLQAARETLRFLEGVGDRHFWAPLARPERLELELLPVAGAHGPVGYTLELAGAGGKRVRVLFDTGSTGLFLVDRAARRLGFEALDDQTVFGGGGNRRHATRRGVVPELSIGALRFKDALATTAGQPIHRTGAYHGVISASAFEGYRVTLDFDARRLVLEPAGDAVEGVPYWIVADQWLVEAEAGNVRGLFLLDTGAARSIVARGLVPDIEGARLGSPARSAGYGGGIRDARRLHGARIRFGKRQTPAEPLLALDLALRSRLGGVELGGFVGLDVLGSGRIVLDTRHRRLLQEVSRE